MFTLGKGEDRKIVVAKMESSEDKLEVIAKKQLDSKKLYIENDLTIEERQIQVIIKGKYERNKRKIGYQKLYVNGKEDRWSHDEGSLKE